jgi:DDE family transposase
MTGRTTITDEEASTTFADLTFLPSCPVIRDNVSRFLDTGSPEGKHFFVRPFVIAGLFSFISLEWAGHPLRSLATMMSYIESTTTKTGLKVTAFVNERKYDIQRSMTCSKRFLYRATRNYQH